MRAVVIAGVGSVATATAAVGGPALAALAAVLAVGLAAFCWVVASSARTANLVDIVKAMRPPAAVSRRPTTTRTRSGRGTGT